MHELGYVAMGGVAGSAATYYFRDSIRQFLQRLRGVRNGEPQVGETLEELATRRLTEIGQALRRDNLNLEFLTLATDNLVSEIQYLTPDQEPVARQLVQDIRKRLKASYGEEAYSALGEIIAPGSTRDLFTDTQIRELSALADRLDAHYRRYGFNQRDIPPAPQQPRRPNVPSRTR